MPVVDITSYNVQLPQISCDSVLLEVNMQTVMQWRVSVRSTHHCKQYIEEVDKKQLYQML